MARGWTVEEREDLKKAIATGALEVEFKDKRTRFRSLAQMQSLLKDMDRELSPTTTRPSTRAMGYDSGL